MLKKVILNRKYLLSYTTKAVTVIYAILGLVGTLAPIDEILPETLTIWCRAGISVGALVVLWLVCFGIITYINLKKRRYVALQANSGHCLYVQYGDLFSQDEVLKPHERRNIIIPVNRCFDTTVDNRIISDRTIHGMAFKKLYEAGLYTEESLWQVIMDALSRNAYEEVPTTDKPTGKTKRYPAGTIVDLPVDSNTHYFLWALSTFDEELHAHTSMCDYAIAVQRLVEACNVECQGYPVVLPLVGAGLSRTEMSQQDIVEYIVESFRVNRAKINSDIHIVVREDLKSDVSIMNLS